MQNSSRARFRRNEAAGIAVLAIFWLLAAGDPAGRAGDWPTYRHDDGRSGSTSDRLQLPLTPRWVYAAPAPPHTAWSGEEGRVVDGLVMTQRVKFDDVFHVAVVGDRVYFGSSVDHQAYCLRADSGAVVWRFFTGGPIRLTPTVCGGRVFFGSDDGYAYCLDAADGRLIWKVRASCADEWLLGRGEMISRWPLRTGVLVAEGVAYFGAGIFPHDNVYLCAVEAATGKVLWRQSGISERNACREDLSPQGHLLAIDDLLVVPSGGSLPAIVDRHSGDLLCKPTPAWRTTAGGAVGGSEALLADGQLYTFGTGHILAVDQRTGKEGFGWFPGDQMVVVGPAAYVTSDEAILKLDRFAAAKASRPRHALEMEIKKLTQSLHGKQKTAETAVRLTKLMKDVVKYRNAGVLWKQTAQDTGTIIAAGELLVAGGDGKVTVYDGSTGKQAWQAAVDGRARGLAAAGGRLWVSTSTGKIYCFAGGAGSPAPIAATAPLLAEPYPRDEQTPRYQGVADEILRRSGVNRGFCLVLGSRQGRLAYELARRSGLKIYCVGEDPRQVEIARQTLSATGLYGSRITAHCFPLDKIPYADYAFNLIVCESALGDGALPDVAEKMAHFLKPCGGVICLGRPADDAQPIAPQQLASWLRGLGLGEQGQLHVEGSWATFTRGPLPGAGRWTHEYAEPGNTGCSDDQRVRGDLGVLWYGDPGPREMVDRHLSAAAPLACDGRFFIQGERKIFAYDAYNGLFLWEQDDPRAERSGVSRGENPGNLAAGDGALFVVADNACHQLDAATGRSIAVHPLPSSIDGQSSEWRYLAYRDGLIFGAASLRSELAARLKRYGKLPPPSDVLFAIDARSGRHLWTVTGHSVPPATVAVAPGRVIFIDSTLSPEQRTHLLHEDKTALRKLSGEDARRAEQEVKKIDLRLAVCLDAHTGRRLWSQPVDVTDCSEVGTGGGKLTMMAADGTLILCGANGNGHYWPQFLAGEFHRRRLVALSADDGRQLWAKDANYRHRPIIVGQRVIAEPWAFDVKTGRQELRTHPITGQEVPWSMMRTGHHCGALAACPHMLTFRTGTTGYYDLDADVGVEHFAGQRPGCWINAIPANGLVIIPEASAGCVCLFSIESTIVLEPRPPRRPWTIASGVGPAVPARHLAINFGAPGDRRDAQGTLWLAYPRPKPYKETGLEVQLHVKPELLHDGGYASVDSADTPVPGADPPWLFTSWVYGMTSCRLPLSAPPDPSARYNVKLYFANFDAASPGTRVFDVKLQGKTVATALDVAAGKPVVRQIDDVAVSGDLLLELKPRAAKPTRAQMPILNAIEVIRRDER